MIFVIRTRRNPFRSRPSPILIATSLAVVAFGILLPFTPAGAWFGFVPLPPGFLAALVGMVVLYLLLTELVKRIFYSRQKSAGTVIAPVLRPGLPLSRK